MADDYARHQERHAALKRLTQAVVVDRNLLHAGDLASIQAVEVNDLPCEQGQTGILVQFAVTHHALGKVMTSELSDDMDTLLGYQRE